MRRPRRSPDRLSKPERESAAPDSKKVEALVTHALRSVRKTRLKEHVYLSQREALAAAGGRAS